MVLYYVSSAMVKLHNNTLEALRPSHVQRSLEEMMRVRCEWDFSRMFIAMSEKAYFDRRTTHSEFYFANNILCNRRSVQWRTTKFEMRKTALQNKLTLNSYSSNGKQTAKRTFDFIKFYAVLGLFKANSGHLQNVYRL